MYDSLFLADQTSFICSEIVRIQISIIDDKIKVLIHEATQTILIANSSITICIALRTCIGRFLYNISLGVNKTPYFCRKQNAQVSEIGGGGKPLPYNGV